jgi:hypothetical protein
MSFVDQNVQRSLRSANFLRVGYSYLLLLFEYKNFRPTIESPLEQLIWNDLCILVEKWNVSDVV